MHVGTHGQYDPAKVVRSKPCRPASMGKYHAFPFLGPFAQDTQIVKSWVTPYFFQEKYPANSSWSGPPWTPLTRNLLLVGGGGYTKGNTFSLKHVHWRGLGLHGQEERAEQEQVVPEKGAGDQVSVCVI